MNKKQGIFIGIIFIILTTVSILNMGVLPTLIIYVLAVVFSLILNLVLYKLGD